MSATEILQRIPSVDQVLKRQAIRLLVAGYSRALVLETVQDCLEELRLQIREERLSSDQLSERLKRLDATVAEKIEQRLSPSLRTVINATGVILHTNIGRAPVSPAVAEIMKDLAVSYSNLEYDLSEGTRGHRDLHFEKRLSRLLSCEAATVANNNAAAVFLILNTLALGKEVLVSRGELIEIGGSFRIPAIMERSGARLKEVGTTNKTKLSDYREAIDENTALILRVHPSNYKIIGFTHRPQRKELVELARERNLPLVEDVGSGYLFPTQQPFLSEEPTVQSALKEGVEVVCFSGDKLFGGPQAGIMVGKQKWIDAVRKNPLMRACRVDKVTYAALEWTLIEYEKGSYLSSLPVYRMLSAGIDEIRKRAERLREELNAKGFHTELKDGHSLIGGGSAPEEQIPTGLLAVTSSRYPAHELERRLRAYSTPIIARIAEDQLILDLRTVFPEQEKTLVCAFATIACG